MASVNTKYGTFEVTKQSAGVKISNGEQFVCLPNVNWWDSDAIIKTIESDEMVKKTLFTPVEKKTTFSDLREANEALLKINNYLRDNVKDNKQRGFVVSRISQVINKLNEELI